MGVKKFIKKSVAFVAAAAMALTMVVAPVGAGAGASYAAPITPSNEPQVNKTAKLQSDGTYKITLESYVTGNVDVKTDLTTTPCDIVLVLDQSGSMEENMSSETTYEARDSQKYSYNSIAYNNNYYYKDDDGEYYKVNADYEWNFFGDNYYYLYYQKGNNTYYLSGSDVVSNQPNNVTNQSDTIWKGILYEQKATSKSRIDSLKEAANSFIDGVVKSATKTGADHRIAVVGFAGNKKTYGNPGQSDYQGEYMNTELFIGSDQYNYGGNSNGNGSNKTDAASTQYGNALQSIKTQKNRIDQSISNLDANGGTYPQYGLEMANGIFNAYKNNNDDTYQKKDGTIAKRNKIVVVFTDGSPGERTENRQQISFDDNVANSAINQAKASKDSDVKVYSVGIFSGADASLDPSLNSTSKQNKFMHFLSSNYPNATSMTNTGTRDSEGAYYKSASNTSDLNNIFKEIAQDTVGGSASVSLGKDAVSKDIISENFDLPKGITEANVANYVEVSTVDYLGDGEWSKTLVPIDDRSTTLSDNEKATISLDKENNTFNISNFDFSANYVGEGTSEAGVTRARGKKLVIEITGITAKHSGEDMETNNTETSISGIYTGSKLVKKYNKPTVSIPDKSYVLDYGKTVVSNTIQNDCGISNVQLCNTVKPSPHETSTTGRYGTFDLTKVSSGGTITYTPGKINWDGFDSAYVFGAVSENEYLWSAVNFIPATSVYYEDDFGSFTKENPNKDSNVAIVWSDGWTSETDKESSKDNSQSNTNSQYGWDENYVDDTQSSNGSSHWAEADTAKATFRFTGTAVDVYSRTNKNVGRILARIKRVNDDGTTTGIKTKTVDNISESSGEGNYYQIPTLFFDNLPYGTYEVIIMVNPITDNDGNPITDENGNVVRARYYLDGIRVYNPLNPEKLDPVAADAYEVAGESNANYITLRNDLITAADKKEISSKIDGAVFIDKSKNGNETSEIGTYKDYGPKNEVYLGKNHGVAFKVDGYNSQTDKVFVGLKSITGKETNVSITGETELRSISSAADLYYEVTPDSQGNVVIKNNTDNILSVTKVRITTKNKSTEDQSTGTQSARKLVVTPQLMSYVADFEKSQGDDKTETDLDKGDVDIDNPSDNDKEDNNQTEQKPTTSVWEKILNSLNKWFKR